MARLRATVAIAAGLLVLALAACSQPSGTMSGASPGAPSTPVTIQVPGSAAPAAGTTDKRLQSVKGSVSYEAPAEPADALVPHTSVVLSDRDYAITGAASLGTLTLPDSSVVTIGAQSKVQLVAFDQAAITTAAFVIVGGTMRFSIHHPQGAVANYTFETPTTQIAVRGTEGDVSVDGDETHVNVYELSDPKLPVQVTVKKSGQRFTLPPGKTFSAHREHGRLVAEAHDLSRKELVRFTGQFGQPRGVTPEGRPRRIALGPTRPSPRPRPHEKPRPHARVTPRPHAHPTPRPRKEPHPRSPAPHPKATAHPKPHAQKKSPHAKPTARPHAISRPHPKATPHANPRKAPHARPSAGPKRPAHAKPHAQRAPHPKGSPRPKKPVRGQHNPRPRATARP